MHEVVEFSTEAIVDRELERTLLGECIYMGLLEAGVRDHRKVFCMHDSETDVLDIRQKTFDQGLVLHEAKVTSQRFEWRARQYELDHHFDDPEYAFSGNREALAQWLLDRAERLNRL